MDGARPQNSVLGIQQRKTFCTKTITWHDRIGCKGSFGSAVIQRYDLVKSRKRGHMIIQELRKIFDICTQETQLSLINRATRLQVSQGHQNGTIPYARYGFLLVSYSNFVPKIFDFKNVVTLKTGLVVREGH